MRFSRTTVERPRSGKIRLLSEEKFFSRWSFSRRGWAGERNGTNIFRDGPRRSRWEDRFYSGLNPVTYSALSRQQRQQQRRRWWRSCMVIVLLFSPPSFLYVPFAIFTSFLLFFFLFFFLPAISPPGFRSLAYTVEKVLPWK